jgi:four helix bundle protein
MGSLSFTELDVWKRAHQATLAVYKITKSFPRDERFGLTQQMRKAASSISANIAEGFGRRQPRDKAYFYVVSKGSLEELRYFLILARDLGYMTESTELAGMLDDTARMLNRLYSSTLGGARS